MNNIIRSAKAYLYKKDRETEAKKRQDKIKGIVKILVVDRRPQESISMLKEVIEIFNIRMDEELKESLSRVEAISKYKKL